MFSGSSLLAVIPARGGSKGLPNKNISICAEKPLINWTIEAAKKSRYIDKVFVSTDSEQIAEVAKKADIKIPVMRPTHLAQDDSSLVDVIKHAWGVCLDDSLRPFDFILVLQPTSPLRDEEHIDAAINTFFRLRKNEYDTLASVYELSQKHGWLMNINPRSGYINFCMDVASLNLRRQNLASYYLPNGAIFIVKGAELERGFYTTNTIPYVMSLNDSVDIDLEEELIIATRLLVQKYKKAD